MDETAIEKAKTVIIESLLGNVEDNIIKKLNTVTDLLQLEIVTEVFISVYIIITFIFRWLFLK